MRKSVIWLLFMVLILFIFLFYIFIGKGQVIKEEGQEAGFSYSIYTSVFPVYEVVKSIAGEGNNVELVVPSGHRTP